MENAIRIFSLANICGYALRMPAIWNPAHFFVMRRAAVAGIDEDWTFY
jgi:hypothetical protein